MSRNEFHDPHREAADDPVASGAGESTSAAQPPVSPSSERAPLPEEIAEAARFPADNPNPVFRVAADGRLLYANRASQPLLAAWHVAGDDRLPPPWGERIAAVLAAGEARKWDAPCDDRILQLQCVPIRGAGYVNVYASDVTEREQLLAQLRERSRELEALNENVLTLNAELEQRVQARTAQLQVLARRLLVAQEIERRALARELHDETGQIVTALSLGLTALARHREITPTVAARLAHYAQMTATLMGELHRVIENLRPSSLEQGGLVPAIARHVETLRDEYGLSVELAAAGVDEPRLPTDVEIALYRLVQEALTNIVRHAQAANVRVEVEQHADLLTAMVCDDGCGFDLAEAVRRGRLGLLGMRERAEMFGGQLVIDTAVGKGTTVRVEFPLVAS